MSTTKPWESKWTLVRSLDGGGQGTTLLVKSRTDDNLIAVLKELTRNESTEARIRMFQEVNNLRAVHTAGAKVPRYLDGNTGKYEDNSVPLFFVMEFVEGPTLEALVRNSGPIALESAVKITLDLCESVRIGHANNVLHRDLKPRNIVIRNQSPADAVILDYGLSFNLVVSKEITTTNEAIENSFLSLPEGRAPGENRRDARSDITALCGILYFCLTAHYPVHPQDDQGKAPHRRNGFGIPVQLTGDSLSHRLNAFFDRGFSQAISSRFQTIDEIRLRLEELLSPDLPDDFDDPAAIAKEASLELLTIDRGAQLHNFARRFESVMRTLNNEMNQASSNLGEFMFGRRSVSSSQITAPEGHDALPVDPLVFSISAPGQSKHFVIIWYFCAVGDECVIRETFHMQHGGGQTKPLSSYASVYRWQGQTGPDASLLIKTFKRSISSAIRRYVAEIKQPSIPGG